MNARTLFSIILKIIGFLFLKDIIDLLPQISSAILALKYNEADEAIWILSITLLMAGVYWLVAYYLIFRTEAIIFKFGLDKGLQENPIPLNIHRSTVLSIAVIVMGGLLIADEIPNFCRYLFNYFQQKRLTNGMASPKTDFLIMAAVKIIIGLLLIGSQRTIVNFIERKRK
jgi:hypothetical protein